MKLLCSEQSDSAKKKLVNRTYQMEGINNLIHLSGPFTGISSGKNVKPMFVSTLESMQRPFTVAKVSLVFQTFHSRWRNLPERGFDYGLFHVGAVRLIPLVGQSRLAIHKSIDRAQAHNRFAHLHRVDRNMPVAIVIMWTWSIWKRNRECLLGIDVFSPLHLFLG